MEISNDDVESPSNKITKNSRKDNTYETLLKVFGIGVQSKLNSNEIWTLIVLFLIIILFIISALGFIVMWFTEYYNNSMLTQLVLSKDSDTVNQWVNPNPKYDTLLKVHIFNYTNIFEFLLGNDSKIHVEDIGPFTYKEHTTKVNVVFNENHTVTFQDHRQYEFLPEKSTHNEGARFIFPNVPLLSAGVKIEKLNIFKKIYAMRSIEVLKENTFKSLTAHELLWGYRDSIVSLDIFSGVTHFGLLMNRNGTSVDSLQINTGEDDIRKLSIITQYNGKPSLEFWDNEECNRIDGTDASMFPPHLLENRDELFVFLSVLCRKIPLRFEKEVKLFKNVEALRYRTPENVFGHPDENTKNWCFCQNTQTCLPSGVINATKCYNDAPIFPSFPHFFSGDPKIYDNFVGINPNKTIHQTFADIHPRFAFPIGGASRIQINIAVYKSKIFGGNMQKIHDGTILPLIWIEITNGEFSEDIIEKLYISTFGLNAIQFALKYGTLLISVTSFTVIVAIIKNFQKKRLQVTAEGATRESQEMSALQDNISS